MVINHEDVLKNKFGHPITERGKADIINKNDKSAFFVFLAGVIITYAIVKG